MGVNKLATGKERSLCIYTTTAVILRVMTLSQYTSPSLQQVPIKRHDSFEQAGRRCIVLQK